MSEYEDSKETREVGDVIDALGCNASLAPDDLIADAVVVLKVVGPNGSVRLNVTWGEGMSFVERRGMLELALDMERITPEGQHRS